MTLDNESEHFHPSPPRKSYNPFDSDDDALDSPSLKPEKLYTKEDHIGFDLKALGESSDALNFCMDNVDLSWEEAVFGEPAVNAYTDKNVTECELPEIIVCYRENNYQSVKDIGIDEGVPIHDKIWVQSSDNESKEMENGCPEVDVVEIPKYDLHPSVSELSEQVNEFVHDDCVKITELKLDVEDVASFAAECVTTTVETDPKKNDSKQGESDFISEDVPDHDDTVKNIASPDKVDDAVEQKATTGDIPSELSTEYREDTVKPDKSSNDEKTLPNSSADIAVQVSVHNSDSNTTGYNMKLETGNQEDKPENVEHPKPPTSQSMTRQEEQRFHGETSFSSITFTGPVSYSGNLSLRSESSAGSTRSFAFPVLQTEWNYSPERMVKADHRLARKHKGGGWVQAFVCCRF